MSEGFPINDLLRRKLQTGLTIATLTLSVASTLFLLLFSSRLGVGLASSNLTLTLGLTAIFSQFILFLGILIFVVGAVLTSFIVFLMMSQRTRDFGLIKAAGCPNSLVGGYFMTELVTVTFVGCILGIVFGFLADFAATQLVFSTYILPNLWYPIIVFATFFILAIFFGLRPIIKAAKMSALDALSPVNYYGLTGETKRKPLSRRGIIWRISLRSLYRRQSASLRIIILLSIVFILLTVSIAGGIIASDTTVSAVETPTGKNTVAIGYGAMVNQYRLLLGNFSKIQQTSAFNYSDSKLAIPDTVTQQLKTLKSVDSVDSRLVLDLPVKEIAGFSLGQNSSQTQFVGGHRQGQSIVIGIDPANVVGSWSVKGRFLGSSSVFEAVVGDSIANSMYIRDSAKKIYLADPLEEGIGIGNASLKIVGICIDPLNNGYSTYVPIDELQNAAGIYQNNLLLVKLNNSINRNAAIDEIRSIVQASGTGLEVLDLNSAVEQNTGFLASSWQTIMLLPLLTLSSAAICLVGYIMLAVDEQHQEFAILRAVGAKPKIIIYILAIQSAIVLFSSFALGISLGINITLVILMKNPLVTSFAIVKIAAWLLAAVLGMFIFSLYPAFRLAKTSILKIMA